MISSRGHKLLPSELDRTQRALYDAIAGGPRAAQSSSPAVVGVDGHLEGPFNAFLLQPSVGQPLQELGAALRYGSSMPDRWREVAILIVASHHDAEVERYFHEPVARSLGLTEEQLDGIRDGRLDVLDGEEALIARATTELVEQGDLSDEVFAELCTLVGEELVFGLTTVVGYYALLALQLRVFAVAPPGHSGSSV